MNGSILPYHLYNKSHCTIELSLREPKKMKYNTIHLSGMYIAQNDLDKIKNMSYINVQYLKHANLKKN